ncbi:hypothetical protein BHM03_00000426 [Ensete ventricosum]|uniref:F-box domain-containing protein n=1 Tax=Ensete ventricosum TaxID=4639 RepID=A0A445M8I6_ENSVE|nr:hypothetical protein BHM03_00000426 [Ensete ventricosum]
MALECRGIEESFPEKLAASPWDEEVPLAGVPSEVLCASSKPKCSKKPSSKSITRKSVSLVPLKKGDSKSERTTADEAGPNGQPPSFTDLPATVVSEILQCLDAKDLGIISCVSTLFNSLASDHYGWKDFYCDRWGPPPGLNPPAGPGITVNHNSNFRLWGHEGPVTCLALDSTRIYSGSWDMSVRIWDRTHSKCLRTLSHGDWVWSLAPRGGTVASTAGGDAYIWNIDTGCLMTVIHNANEGNAYSLTRSHLGDLLFTGGEDGMIHMYQVSHDCDAEDIKPLATWIPHTGPVHSLAFEFPWVVSSSSDGRIALIDVRKLLKSGQSSTSRQQSQVKRSTPDAVEPPQRMYICSWICRTTQLVH